MMLQVLIDDIVNTEELAISIRMATIEDRMKKWKQHYRLIVEFIRRLNQCFAWSLLFYLTKAFVSVTNFTFSMLITTNPVDLFAGSHLIATNLFCFSVIVYMSHRIQSKVNISSSLPEFISSI